LKVIWYI